VKRLRDDMTVASKVRYLMWRAMKSTEDTRVRLKTRLSLVLRPEPFLDLAIAREVFTIRAYRFPDSIRREAVRLIVDVGSNVGYTCLFWLNNFPNAHVIGIEPHPRHLTQLRKNIEINGWQERVTILECGAGTADGRLYLVDDGPSSHLTTQAGANTIDVQIIDLLAYLKGKNVDLLKFDIEGSEYELLADPRFESLLIKNLVMEWHENAAISNAHSWCHRRLGKLGYKTTDTPEEYTLSGPHGMIWATRS